MIKASLIGIIVSALIAGKRLDFSYVNEAEAIQMMALVNMKILDY